MSEIKEVYEKVSTSLNFVEREKLLISQELS